MVDGAGRKACERGWALGSFLVIMAGVDLWKMCQEMSSEWAAVTVSCLSLFSVFASRNLWEPQRSQPPAIDWPASRAKYCQMFQISSSASGDRTNAVIASRGGVPSATLPCAPQGGLALPRQGCPPAVQLADPTTDLGVDGFAVFEQPAVLLFLSLEEPVECLLDAPGTGRLDLLFQSSLQGWVLDVDAHKRLFGRMPILFPLAYAKDGATPGGECSRFLPMASR